MKKTTFMILAFLPLFSFANDAQEALGRAMIKGMEDRARIMLKEINTNACMDIQDLRRAYHQDGIVEFCNCIGKVSSEKASGRLVRYWSINMHPFPRDIGEELRGTPEMKKCFENLDKHWMLK